MATTPLWSVTQVLQWWIRLSMAAIKVPDGVGRTALGMALVRAEESSRSDRLFDDPYAQAFVAGADGALPDGGAPSSGEMMAAVRHGAVVRTRFYDDFLLGACVSGCRQVVLVAAGLDCRAFRLPWPAGVHLLEIDLPEVLAFKERVLAGTGAVSRCRRVPVAVDVREDWPAMLLAAGFRPSEPTAWLLEGLLIYLTADETTNLLEAVTRQSGAGSHLACERQASGVNKRLNEPVTPRLAQFTAMWKGGLGPATPLWLAEHGWQVRVEDRDIVADAYGRPSPSPSDGGYITAVLSTA
jgi:methyltransferase (TIGR00027 family)